MTRAMSPEVRRIGFDDLFDDIGTVRCGFSPRAGDLSGQAVEIDGFLIRPHGPHTQHLLVANPGACPDCSAAPEPTIVLCDVAADPAAIIGADGRVRAVGTLEYGFEISPTGDASFLRLRGAAWHAAAPTQAAF
jgi:hypothetical protein